MLAQCTWPRKWFPSTRKIRNLWKWSTPTTRATQWHTWTIQQILHYTTPYTHNQTTAETWLQEEYQFAVKPLKSNLTVYESVITSDFSMNVLCIHTRSAPTWCEPRKDWRVLSIRINNASNIVKAASVCNWIRFSSLRIHLALGELCIAMEIFFLFLCTNEWIIIWNST